MPVEQQQSKVILTHNVHLHLPYDRSLTVRPGRFGRDTALWRHNRVVDIRF